MHWTERQRAVVRIGEELQRRGWELYGYTPDRSEPLTDYYAPASWSGVAVKGDAVACVDVDAYTARNTGQDIVRRHSMDKRAAGVVESELVPGEDAGQVPDVDAGQVPGEACARCQGSGIWPGGLSYEAAQANPLQQHFIEYCAEKGSRPGHPDVVSPLHYHGVAGEATNPDAPYGAPKCLDCAGRGHHQERVDRVVGRWPAFRANPRGRTWHVERGGRIVGSGVGLQACAHWDSARTASAVLALCDRIEALACPARRVQLPPTTRERVSIAAGIVEGHVPFTVYEEGDWTWIAFSTKPSAALRQRLKQAGARWGRKRSAWCFRRTGVDLAALGLSEQPDNASHPVVWAAQQDGVAPPGAGDCRPAMSEPAEGSAAGDMVLVPAVEAAPQDNAADSPPVQGDMVARQDSTTVMSPTPGGAAAQQDATDHRPVQASASAEAPSQTVEVAPQDAGDYRLAELACPACGLDYHGLVGSRAAVPDPARCPRCGAGGETPVRASGPAQLALFA